MEGDDHLHHDWLDSDTWYHFEYLPPRSETSYDDDQGEFRVVDQNGDVVSPLQIPVHSFPVERLLQTGCRYGLHSGRGTMRFDSLSVEDVRLPSG